MEKSKINIDELKREVLSRFQLFGRILSKVEFEEVDSGTASTNGKRIRYNLAFLETLSYEQQIFTITHELFHIAFDHIKRKENKDIQLWNVATDAVINQMLINSGLEIPEGAINYADAANYDAEEYYDILKEKQKNNEDKSKDSPKNHNDWNSSKNQTNSSSNDSQNNHQNDSKQKDDSNGNTSNEQEDDLPTNNSSNGDSKSNENSEQKNETLIDKLKDLIDKVRSLSDKELQKEIDKMSKMGEKEAFKQNKEMVEKSLENLKKELDNFSFEPGKETHKKETKINIGKKTQILDWRRMLKANITNDYDWSYRRATIEHGVITPHLERNPYSETEILLDTSGSVDDELLKNFLKECKNILETSKIKIGCFDTEFYGFTTIRTEEDIDNMKFVGRGGTDFDVAISAFTNRASNKIIFTDGFAQMPKRSYNAIWIVYENTKIDPKGGKVIYVDPKELKASKKRR